MTESGVRLERVSICYYLPPTGNDYSESNHYPSMFADDVAKDLFPVDGEMGREAVFQLSPNDEHVSGIIESAFARYGGRGRYGRELSSILSGFGNQTAHSLVSSGAETFEVAPTVDANGQAIGSLVLRLPRVWKFAGFTWQTIPKNALANAHGENPQPVNRRLIWLPQERIVQMKLPRAYKRIPSGLKALRHMGRALPDFAIHNRNPDGTLRVPYDLEELTGIEQRAVATITRSTGWRDRGTFGGAVTSYYTMCRFLRFEVFKIRLRETVVNTINRILAIAGAAVGFKGAVSLHNLPTLEEVAASRSDLAAGRLDYAETLDQYSIYRRSRASSRGRA